MAPKDEDELADMMFTATHEKHPVFIRYPRGPAEGVPVKEQPRLLEIGKAEVIQNFSNNGGRKVALFPLGNMMSLGRQAAAQLAAEGYDVADHQPALHQTAGCGSHRVFWPRRRGARHVRRPCARRAATAALCWNCSMKSASPLPVIQVGWPDQFIEHATTVDDLREKYGLTVENTLARVRAEFAGCQSLGPAIDRGVR